MPLRPPFFPERGDLAPRRWLIELASTDGSWEFAPSP
jgi:hypothetical protein